MAKVIIRKPKKELWMWRIIFLAIVVSFFLGGKDKKQEIKEDCIVKTRLQGEIFYDDEVLDNIEYLQENDKVKGVLLQIDSPGGTMTGSEAMYKAFKRLQGKKPLVAAVENAAASGGYMSILGANKIFAYESSVVGSIGVTMEGFIDFSNLAEKIGIKFYNYKSSPLKAIPNNFEKPTEEGNKSLQKLVDEMQLIFKDIVHQNRPNIKNFDLISNGEAFTGRLALEYGLIDAIGTERDALDDLKNNYSLSADLPVVDYEILPGKDEAKGFWPILWQTFKIIIK